MVHLLHRLYGVDAPESVCLFSYPHSTSNSARSTNVDHDPSRCGSEADRSKVKVTASQKTENQTLSYTAHLLTLRCEIFRHTANSSSISCTECNIPQLRNFAARKYVAYGSSKCFRCRHLEYDPNSISAGSRPRGGATFA